MINCQAYVLRYCRLYCVCRASTFRLILCIQSEVTAEPTATLQQGVGYP